MPGLPKFTSIAAALKNSGILVGHWVSVETGCICCINAARCVLGLFVDRHLLLL